MLNIYRASAGAGKTHLLTGEYIKLLFRKDLLPPSAEHDTRFDEILAVTFTNKSTAEMKARIVKELNILSENPTESHYYKEVLNDGLGGTLTDEQIRTKSKAFLTDILNNYSDFAISTIDSFFQKIVRSFARELNLQCNYEVELNSNRILDIAVSSLLDKLDQPKHKLLFKWLLKFSEKKIEEGTGWRLERDLQQLAKSVLTSEDYRTRNESIKRITEDKDWLNNYIGRLQDISSGTKKNLIAIGEQGLKTISDGGMLTTDFKGGSKSKMKIFEAWSRGEIKEPDDTIIEWAESEDYWYAKNAKAGKLPEPQTAIIKELFRQAVEMKNNDSFINYYSAKAILDNIYQLGILADIDKEVNEYCNEEGSMLLSSTTEMLNRLIGDDDAPFIYEKTGTIIHSFMIDEFQDTSKMQWNNFKPLISNSLADGRENLIVGDVKQSIYRWRGSDWGLLHKGLKKFGVGQSLENRNKLKTNYRSLKGIISFNNGFFKYASTELAKLFNDQNITSIYEDLQQEINPKALTDVPGVVDIKFLETSKEEKFEELAMSHLPNAIMQLEDSGFMAKDIAILCRTKNLCKKAAEALLSFKAKEDDNKKYVFDIISSEALLLSTRHVIQTIISILRYIQKPESKILRSIASCNYLQQGSLNENESVRQYFKGFNDIDRFLEFSNRPLYDMVEGIISQIPSINKDIAYVQAFRDCVLEFTNNKKSDISAFLEWWEQYGCDLCINTPEGQNAIRIMTIHKAKGLGMPAVILPCCEGSNDISSRNGDILWCEPKKAPFKEEGLILPVKCSKGLTNTIFAEDYESERLKAIIDNLNTIYVAYTRAKEAMVIFAPASTDKTKPDSQEALLNGYANLTHKELANKTGKITSFTIGEYKRKNGFEKDEKPDIETISQVGENSILQRKLPRLSLKHDKLTKDIEAIERGNSIHEALSVINNYSDIEQPIKNLYESRRLSPNLFTCQQMIDEIKRLLENEKVRKWFVPGLKVLNEKTILASTSLYDGREKTLHRPDRIVFDGETVIIIDYKTGEHLKKHYRQVREYMSLMSQMGFKKVEGYLWYIYPHEIVKVENKGYNKPL